LGASGLPFFLLSYAKAYAKTQNASAVFNMDLGAKTQKRTQFFKRCWTQKYNATGRKNICKGSVCLCIAVKKAQYRKLGQLFNPAWVDAMVSIIERENNSYFRWHDAGDIQSIKHFKNIVDVANKTPAITHWIPTREHKIINDFIKAGNTIPDNLIVRISATNIDGKPPKNASHTSTVHSKSEAIGFECKAPSQSGSCLDCRACWDTNIKNVSYKQH
jgi:hypothetical protein